MTSSPFNSFLEEVEAKTTIEDLLKEMARLNDSGAAVEKTINLFHEETDDDAEELSEGEGNNVRVWTRKTISNFITAGRGKSHFGLMTHSSHMITNIRLMFATTELAAAETYLLVTQKFLPPHHSVESGMAAARTVQFFRYVDRIERRDGVWKLVKRRVVLGDGWVMQMETDTRWALGAKGWEEQAIHDPLIYSQLREREDPFARLTREIGL